MQGFKKYAYKAAHGLRRVYYFVFRPNTAGVKALIRCGDEILLIKNSYGHDKWNLPGGGIKKGEVPADAARREVMEELEIDAVDMRKVGDYVTTAEYKRDTVFCFACRPVNKEFRIDRTEIKEARWFPVGNLPDDRTLSVSRVLEMDT